MQTKEWLYHIEKWLRERERHIYRQVAEVELTYRLADRWMSAEEADAGTFGPVPAGVPWGVKWGYAWFRGEAVIPPEAEGRRVVLELDVGAESTVFVNGRAAGASDHQHRHITLAVSAEAGARYAVLAEAYGGHDAEQPLPVAKRTTLSVVNEELYQFFIDLKALYQLRQGLEPASLRVSELDKGFRRLIAELDWSPEDGDLEREAAKGRAILRPLLACVNGSTSPKLYLMGQSHLDIAWLWPIEETKRKIARTMSNQLALLDEYPEYIYTQSQPYLFQLVKTLYPELYERIREKAAQGRIVLEGGMWVEPDTTIPSGESLIRQFAHGKRFLLEEFGVDTRMLWLPDVFGYSGNLPQIMRGCGIDFFASVKMFQTYDNVVDPFPYNTFEWEGIDGSAVPVHLLDYGPYPNPADVAYAMLQWNERVQKEGIATRLVQFGYGDGGGGANRDDLESIRRLGDLEGVPRTEIASPIAYFEDQLSRGMPEGARYAGELYYPAHRGTLTSQAKMKRGNREAELALREAELWSAAASLGTAAYPQAELEAAWKRLLLLQFHDILPGTSIRRVHEEAEREFAELIGEAVRLTDEAARSLLEPKKAGGAPVVSFFNSLAWERDAIVALPSGCVGARGVGGEPVPVQATDGTLYARLRLPAMGAVAIEAAAPAAASDEAGTTSALKATDRLLENEYLRVELNERGEIVRLYDKEKGTEWLSEGGFGNRFRLYRDQPSNFDAWEIDRRYAESEIDLPEPATIAVVGEGPLFAAVRIERALNRSALVQEIRLAAGSRTIEFRTGVSWKEKHKLLKVGFDADLRSTELISEIQFGCIKRPTHRSRPHDADRFEVSQQKWSALAEGDRCFAVLNDGKYGLHALGGHIGLTLLRSPTYPDDRADEGWHEFTYAVHLWDEAGGFHSSPVIREAYELNRPVWSLPGSVRPLGELFGCDRPNVVVDAVKLADDGSGDWIVRLYEGKGASTRCTLRVGAGLPLAEARTTDMLEQRPSAQPLALARENGGAAGIALAFAPFEVKTLRLVRRTS